ncbi:MAG: alpha/beta hydrolase fold domain-containing protein [Phycisphaera sp.]|nr:alpha/beta hydrolase fold domain-containing protein [Phycisphaera sp.]
MKSTTLIGLLALTLLAHAGLVRAAEMQTKKDIHYTDANVETQALDVYAPTEGSGHPVVVWIHGGGWRAGDKHGVQIKPQAFVDKGLVFVSINYRFVPRVTVKEMTGDVAKAIRYVRDHVEKVGGDSTKLFVAGHSAGAHLAALVCTDGRYLEAEGMSLKDISGCFPVDTAAYDVPAQLASIGPLRSGTYTGAFTKDEATQRDLSPITHVAKDRHIPPFLLLHVADRQDSGERSNKFAEALHATGIEATVVPAEGTNHGTINANLGKPGDKPTEAVFAFIEKHSKLASTP